MKSFDRLWEEGGRDRFYNAKFKAEIAELGIDKFRQKVAREYGLGLKWVLKYYYNDFVHP